MRGHVVKVIEGGVAFGRYLETCAHGYGDYLEGPISGGLALTRYVDGVEVDSRRIGADGLERALSGLDPVSGVLLKGFKRGQVRAYELPVNDSKDLDAAGVPFDDVWKAHEGAQARGEKALREYVTGRLLVRLRTSGGRRWVRPDEVVWISATHATSRDGDPELHRHLELVNRVRVGSRWYAVDSVRLFGTYRNMRDVYETTVYGDPGLNRALTQHGMSLSMDGTIPEIKGAADVFSKRRDAINARLDELVDEWRHNPDNRYHEVHDIKGSVVGYAGYRNLSQPDRKTMLKLRRQAWSETRKAKTGSNTAVDFQAWNKELKEAGYDLPTMLHDSAAMLRIQAGAIRREDAELAGRRAVAVLSGKRSAWSLEDLEAECMEQVRILNPVGDRNDLKALCARIEGTARELCSSLSADPRAQVRWARSLTSSRVKACEDDVRGRLAVRGIEAATPPNLSPLAGELSLDTGQRQALETICSDSPLVVVEGAAGAGKTHMLRAVKEQCDRTGTALTLVTPTRRAAQSATHETGMKAGTVMGLLEAYGWRHNPDDPDRPWRQLRQGDTDYRGNIYHGVPERMRLEPGSLLVVDEAGMVGMDQARALLRIADENRIRLALVGDSRQLPAVGRGGLMRIAREYAPGTVVMDNLHRFKDPDYAAFTIRLRERGPQSARNLAREIRDRGMVHRRDTDEDTVAAIAETWMRQPDTVISTATNMQARQVNHAIQSLRSGEGQVGGTGLSCMDEGERVFAGDRIMARRNDREAGVANRQVFTVINADTEGLDALDDQGRTHRLARGYVQQHVQLGYASTTYGAQGVTAREAILYAGHCTTGADLYVALTRGRNSNSIYLSAANDRDADTMLEYALTRERGDEGLAQSRQSLTKAVDTMSLDVPLGMEQAKELKTMERWAVRDLPILRQHREQYTEETSRRDQLDTRITQENKTVKQLETITESAARDLGEASEAHKDAMNRWDRRIGKLEQEQDAVLAAVRADAGRRLDHDLARLHELPGLRQAYRQRDELNKKTFVLHRRTKLEQADQTISAIIGAERRFEDSWGVDHEDAAQPHVRRQIIATAAQADQRAVDAERRIQDAKQGRRSDPTVERLKRANHDHDQAKQRLTQARERHAALTRQLATLHGHADLERTEANITGLEEAKQEKTPARRHQLIDRLYRPGAMRKYRKARTEQQPHPRLEQALQAWKSNPADPRWLQPAPDPDSQQNDRYMGEWYNGLSEHTIGDILQYLDHMNAPEPERADGLSAVRLNHDADLLHERERYADRWNDAIGYALDQDACDIGHLDTTDTRSGMVRELRERAQQRIDEWEAEQPRRDAMIPGTEEPWQQQSGPDIGFGM